MSNLAIQEPYYPNNQIPGLRLAALLTGSILLGILAGITAYYVSQIIYLLFVFAIITGFFAGLAFQRILLWAKVRQGTMTTAAGILVGVLMTVTYFAIPYWTVRNNFITDARVNYQVDSRKAVEVFNQLLKDETGSGGLLGFMLLRAREGDTFTQYMTVNYLPVGNFDFTLQGGWAWFYWLCEGLLFSLPAAWIGHQTGSRPVSRTTGEWFDTAMNQIGTARLEDQETLLSFIHNSDLKGVSSLVEPEDHARHPQLELYEQSTATKIGSRLLILKATNRTSPKRVKRTLVGQWEITTEALEELKANNKRMLESQSNELSSLFESS